MIVFAPLEIVAVGVLLLGGAVLVRQIRPGRRDVQPRREWRVVQATRVLGLAGGVMAAYSLAGRLEYGRGEMLAPSVFGLAVVIAVAVGETVVRPRRPAGPRSASLRTRRIGEYLPRWTAWSVLGTGAALAATLTLTTATASWDDWARGMRVISCTSVGAGSSTGPYPGSFYSLPLASVLVAVLLVAGVAAHQVIRRPRGLAETDSGEDVLRKRSLTVIIAATGVAIAFSHAGVAATAGTALVGLGGCAPAWAAPVGWLVGLSALPALFVGVWCLVRIVSNDSLERSGERSAERSWN